MQQSIISQAAEYVKNQFDDPSWENYKYHDIVHTQDVVSYVQLIGKEENVSDEDLEVLTLAAWFHDIGYNISYEHHEDEGIKISTSFLTQAGYPSEKINAVAELIESTKMNYDGERDSLSKKIIHDADHHYAGSEIFSLRSDLLRQELELINQKELKAKEWNKLQSSYLKSTEFLTNYGQQTFTAHKKINRSNVKSLIKKKSKKKVSKETVKYGRAIETMYRVLFRDQINMSAIADNKANMLIGINAVMLSVLISLFGGSAMSGSGISMDFKVMVPVIVLLITSGVAMINATMAARPNVPKLTKYHEGMSIFFFANFIQMPKTDFVEKMDEFKMNEKSIYSHLAENMYDHGIVLNKKYLRLKVAYNIFMYGLATSIILLIVLNVFF